MSRTQMGILGIALAVLLVAVPAAAELFTVTLKNGASFDTRYQPRVHPDRPGQVLFLTDVGNWIALGLEDVDSVAVETETKGFGMVINTTTVMLGYAPNDAEEPGEGGQMTPTEQLLRMMQDQQAPRQDFTTQQFVEPSEAGQGGLPLWGPSSFTVPLGSVQEGQ